MEVTVEKITKVNIILNSKEASLLRTLLQETRWNDETNDLGKDLLNHLVNAGVEAI